MTVLGGRGDAADDAVREVDTGFDDDDLADLIGNCPIEGDRRPVIGHPDDGFTCLLVHDHHVWADDGLQVGVQLRAGVGPRLGHDVLTDRPDAAEGNDAARVDLLDALGHRGGKGPTAGDEQDRTAAQRTACNGVDEDVGTRQVHGVTTSHDGRSNLCDRLEAVA